MNIDPQHISMSTHTNTSMGSTNISIKQEAYDYLKSIKSEEESFSDAIIKLKNQRANTNTILDIINKHKAASNEYIKKRKQTIQRQREQIQKRIKQ